MSEPRFTHSCTVCKWLGQHDTYDLYLCHTVELQGGAILVARFGDGVRMYMTLSLHLYRGTPEELPGPFARAHKLATSAGYLP